MADDIVERLQNSCAHNTGDPQRCTRCGRENAYAVGLDAVELIKSQQAEIERLRVALEIANNLSHVMTEGYKALDEEIKRGLPHACSTGFFPCWCEEARRG